MSELFGIQVEILDSVPPGQVLLVNRSMWEQIKGQSAEPEWRGVRDANVTELRAEVERLTAKLQAVRDEYAAALATRDRRILDALAVLDSMIRQEWGRYDGGIYFLTRVRNALRGDA